MSHNNTLFESQIAGLELLNRGKVRDMYAVDEDHLLMVTTDRLSAFDVVLPDPIPGKGKVLTDLSLFWFGHVENLIPSHLSSRALEEVVTDPEERAPLEGRSLVVQRLKPLPIESIVRGYLIGSGWKDYQKTGSVSGVELPSGLNQASRLPENIFTPSTKADVGEHDENVDFEWVSNRIGRELAEKVRDVSLIIYSQAADYALSKGIVIADTKFEFGLNDDGELVLIDEVLTPDSSRFWPADEYREGTSPPSFDKQFVRDYLETLDWDKKPPGPKLPDDIIRKTAARYREARDRLTAE